MKKQINIALCMNDREESKTLGMQLLELGFDVKVFACRSLDELIDCFTKNEINCFVFEYRCQKFNAKNIALKLGKSTKFKGATFIFVSDKENIGDIFEDVNLKVDLVITRPIQKRDYATQLKEIWKRQSGRVIPENLNVLILDNNPRVIELLEMHMELLHHKNFETCYSVEEAKKKLTKKDYDLLLLDWDLDDGTCMDVIDMARSSTSSARQKEALTIVITGRNAVEDIMTLVEKNVKDHIIKPFDHHEFEDKISYALERHQKRLGDFS